jgi:peptide/nickel transport system substrate-binding protein
VTDLASDPAITVVDAPWSHFTPLIFNTRGAKEGPAYEGGPVGPGASTDALADPAFRDALGYAIDHQALVDKVLDGHGKPGLGPVAPSDTVNFTGLSEVARTFDVELAKQKLDAAGYVDSNGDGTREDKSGKELNLEVMISSSTPTNALSAQFLFRQVGVGLTATSLDEASAFDRYYGNSFDIFVASFRPDVNGRMSFFSGEGDAVGWVSSEYNDLLARLDAATDPAERKELTTSLDRLIYTDGPWNILYYPNLVQAYRAETVAGWEESRAADLPIVTDDMFVAPIFAGLTPVAAAEPSASSGAPSLAPSAGPSAAPGPSDATSGSSTLPIAIGAIAVVAIVGVIVLRRRRSGGTE